MARPSRASTDVAAYQPPLTRWGIAGRLGVVLLISALVCADAYPAIGRSWRVVFDLAGGIAALVAVRYRRRFPLHVALATLVLATVTAAASGPMMLAAASVATRRRYAELAVLTVLNFGSSIVYDRLVPSAANSEEPFWVTVAVGSVAYFAVIGWGMYIGSRRELLWELRQRAERAEAERDLRERTAQADERARIAREMHDVLAHRISQISMHAGALAFRTDLDADALRAGIGDVQARANDALTDLRGVLGVLRDRQTGAISHRPQPTYAEVAAMVADARTAGAHVVLDETIDAGPVPEALGRTLYRVIQEGITNAHKHAPGALLSIGVDGGPDRGVRVTMRNPLGFGLPAAPGAGLGLVGLAERVHLNGGELTSGRAGGEFVLRVWLPWEA